MLNVDSLAHGVVVSYPGEVGLRFISNLSATRSPIQHMSLKHYAETKKLKPRNTLFALFCVWYVVRKQWLLPSLFWICYDNLRSLAVVLYKLSDNTTEYWTIRCGKNRFFTSTYEQSGGVIGFPDLNYACWWLLFEDNVDLAVLRYLTYIPIWWWIIFRSVSPL